MIPEKFRDHVDELLDDGYAIKQIEQDTIVLIKSKLPLANLLPLFLMGPLGWYILLVNMIIGYDYGVKLTDKNGQIEVKTF